MKAIRFSLLIGVAMFATLAYAQSDAKKSFTTLKTLAGEWEGKMTSTPPTPEVEGKTVRVTLRVTSMGNALMHEMRVEGREDDPITMLYLEDDRLALTHFCDAGNRPRMFGKSEDGKRFEYHFADITGNLRYGHMHGAEFNIADADHHSEDWTFMVSADKSVRAHMELHRVK